MSSRIKKFSPNRDRRVRVCARSASNESGWFEASATERSHHSAIYLRNIYFSSVANMQMLWRYSEPRAQSPRSQCL